MSIEMIQLPCTPVVDGIPTMCEFTGEVVGKMFVHREFPDDSGLNVSRGHWTVTHLGSGCSIKKQISRKAHAVRLAKQLSAMDCWDFTDPNSSKSIQAEAMNQIRDLLRVAA